MDREIKLLLCAIQFLTRLPVPAIRDFRPEWITRSARYYPIVGQIVGLLMAVVLIVANNLWSGLTPAVLAFVAGILVTGALHEDGLADAADGLAGGATRPARLAIMKDSRVGTYGVLAIVTSFVLKIAALSAMPATSASILLIAVHGGARAAAVCLMRTLDYAGQPAASKVDLAPFTVKSWEIIVAIIVALWPFLLLTPQAALFSLTGGAIGATLIGFAARRLLGGYTGDILGAAEQLFEVGALLGAASFWGLG